MLVYSLCMSPVCFSLNTSGNVSGMVPRLTLGFEERMCHDVCFVVFKLVSEVYDDSSEMNEACTGRRVSQSLLIGASFEAMNVYFITLSALETCM